MNRILILFLENIPFFILIGFILYVKRDNLKYNTRLFCHLIPFFYFGLIMFFLFTVSRWEFESFTEIVVINNIVISLVIYFNIVKPFSKERINQIIIDAFDKEYDYFLKKNKKIIIPDDFWGLVKLTEKKLYYIPNPYLQDIEKICFQSVAYSKIYNVVKEVLEKIDMEENKKWNLKHIISEEVFNEITKDRKSIREAIIYENYTLIVEKIVNKYINN